MTKDRRIKPFRRREKSNPVPVHTKRSASVALIALVVCTLIAPLLSFAHQAFAAGSVSDGFSRANGSLGAGWTDVTDGGLAISSQVVIGTQSGYSGDIRTGETYSSDQSSQIAVTATQLSGGQWIGPAVRAQKGGQSLYLGLYFWNNGSPQLMLFKRIGGNWTQLGSSYQSGPLAAGTQLTLTATGSTLSFSQNGVVRITATDTSLTGGAPAIMAYGSPTADNWTGTGTSSGTSPTTFSVGGSVSGLSGTVVLENNAGNDLTQSANGAFTFTTPLASGAAYNVTVKTNPAGQVCTVANPTGTMASANITNVTITCSTQTFSVGGSVGGLSGTVVLENNAGDDLTQSANGAFTFTTPLASGAAYNVTVKTNPAGQVCTVANPTGTIASANVTNLIVTCATSGTLTVGGSVSGLSGTVVLKNNAGNDLTQSANGAFTFTTPLASGAPYNVTVKTNPAGQVCTVANPTGTIASANVTNVVVTCATQSAGSVSDGFSRANGSLGAGWTDVTDGGLAISSQVVIGTQSGYSGDIRTGETYSSDQSSQIAVTATQLSGGQWIGPAVRAQKGGQSLYLGLYFWNNGSPQLMLFKRIGGNWTQLGSSYQSGPLAAGTQLTLTATGSTLSFSQNGVVRITATDTSLTGGAPAIMAYGSPTADNWTGTGTSSGTSPTTFSVGGSVSGLSGTVVLENNAGNDLTQSANGAFTFTTPLASGAAYNVTVKTNPAGQVCTVANPTGTMASANITNVTITCATSGGSAGGGFQVQYVSTDANSVDSYSFVSANDGYGSHILRVLRPTHPTPGVAHNFLFVLPVEAGLGTTFGDGLDTLQALDAQDQYNLTIIEPTFGIDPWYADNPTDSGLQYETFMTAELQPWVKANLSTTGSEQSWLIGFSKSGIGGEDLILKHPDLFSLVASWDFPADMSSYDEYGSSSAASYGTEANFEANYELTTAFLDAHKAPFLSQNRIWIGGYNAFQTDISDYDALLTSEGIPHTMGPSQLIAHRWDSGWVPAALAALYQDSLRLP